MEGLSEDEFGAYRDVYVGDKQATLLVTKGEPILGLRKQGVSRRQLNMDNNFSTELHSFLLKCGLIWVFIISNLISSNK